MKGVGEADSGSQTMMFALDYKVHNYLIKPNTKVSPEGILGWGTEKAYAN